MPAGNEFNLQLDGCGLSKDAGDFFTTREGMAFLRSYRDVVTEADDSRSINTGMAAPRSHAFHASQSPTGCINATVALDTAADTAAILAVYAEGFDFVSLHYYGCRTTSAVYGWCNVSTPDPLPRGDLTIIQVSLSALSMVASV